MNRWGLPLNTQYLLKIFSSQNWIMTMNVYDYRDHFQFN